MSVIIGGYCRMALDLSSLPKAWEAHGQLDWYHRIIKHTHPGWKVVCIYLSPSGAALSHDAYVPVGYGTLCDLLDRILEERGSTLDTDVRVLVEHYVGMVRRRILGDPEVVRLAQQIYQKHGRAIEVVNRHRPKPPDYPTQIRPVIEGLIEQNLELVKDLTAKQNIKFGVKVWDDAPAIPTAEGWTDSNRILLFVVYNTPTSLDLHLSIGPGPERIRRGLFEMAANHDVFVEPRPNDDKAIRARTWPLIFTRHLLKPEAFERVDQEQREQEIRRRWEEFLGEDLSRIVEAVNSETWIWEPIETDPV